MTSQIVSDPAPIEATRPTANIIAFPVRLKPVQPQPEDRLTRALESLNTAMMEQRAAVAAWRAALGELRATTSDLDESLQRCRRNLGSLGNSVSALHAKARCLEHWADQTIAAE